MRGYYTADQVRAAEAELFTRVAAGVPMRRAAHGLARVVAEELRVRTGAVYGRAVTLLVGSGDNGGDALWAGAELRGRGVAVSALLLDPERAHAAGLAALIRRGGRVVDELGAPDLVVDGIVGLSGRGPLRPRAAELVAAVRVPIISVDLPSGVDPDTGAVDGPAVTADVTVAFGAYKPVHALAAPRCGRVELVPIGLRLPAPDLIALDPADVGAGWPVPGPDDDKYTQGVTGICAGSVTYPGAAVLCTGAAVAATSGMVRYAGTADVLAHWPEVVAASSVADAGRVQTWVVGPGSGTGGAAEAHLRQVLAEDVPVVVDADGLTLLGSEPALLSGRRAPTVLTPHDREFARLAGCEPGADRVAAVRQLAEQWQVTVLLKGYATLIATPGRPVLVNVAGGAWASTAGSGDVLSGVIGALLAAGADPAWAAAAAARAHALAASLAADGAPIAAETLLAHLRPAVRTLRTLAAAVAADGVPGTGECCVTVAGWQDLML
ncbi:bifunctional ADP-dependent NAD(P)H-hydrate dehydratase/NAD(P)H-hydrate epimerase [Nocardia stercoris]|uniref:Bifunctional NAD(P)H-hydrate repair enzyme n=1 Tax=Nocardia stercoris TaxID=2483361 RepID=A0A3M2L5G7_9NOCA|nr:bifunctional ADP-dependent NAD(P)H-hydrate dehydratase/NAD(P)H-hydrate epimerase [Nocardia stercoris]RMI31960.1 bifunctional ADP-dependent NAD(P)H-hydrate dehydratase/NAD(P)H-hydrate epimerase [Nocardia stercoris]